MVPLLTAPTQIYIGTCGDLMCVASSRLRLEFECETEFAQNVSPPEVQDWSVASWTYDGAEWIKRTEDLYQCIGV